jgi:predicted  nucleic acid-binding Zn-ribbon protein
METSQQSTSRSGNDYSSTLIGTVSELRMELQRTMAEVQSVKDQNRSLLSNNQVIKDELLDTRKNYSEAYENYMATVTEKLEAERQNEAFMDRLKKQLLEKTKEFDLMRDKNSPQDIDTIRIKVQEELEIPHREKMIKIQNELQEQKSRTFDIKRQYDVLKTDFGVMLKSSQREVLSLKEQYDQVERRHRDEIMRLQDREMSPEKDEQTIRAQGAQINELRHIGEKLKEDVRSMRQIKDDAVYSLQQSEARIEEVYVQLRARAAIAEAEKLAIEHRLDHATAEGERKDAVIRSVRLEAEQMTYNFNDAKRQLSEVEAKLSSANIDYTSDIQNMKDSYDVELLEFERIRTQVRCTLLAM